MTPPPLDPLPPGEGKQQMKDECRAEFGGHGGPPYIVLRRAGKEKIIVRNTLICHENSPPLAGGD
jgi:hypothetical protein